MSASKCPVCEGRGTVVDYDRVKGKTWSGELPRTTCHGCSGKGWVVAK